MTPADRRKLTDAFTNAHSSYLAAHAATEQSQDDEAANAAADSECAAEEEIIKLGSGQLWQLLEKARLLRLFLSGSDAFSNQRDVRLADSIVLDLELMHPSWMPADRSREQS